MSREKTHDLRPGDKVIVRGSSMAGDDIGIVERVTPTGRVTLVGGRKFDARLRSGSGWNFSSIRRATADELATIRERKRRTWALEQIELLLRRDAGRKLPNRRIPAAVYESVFHLLREADELLTAEEAERSR